jgi:hypothetical protein
VTFPDLVDFVEKEARIANNPIFGNISERPKAWPAKGKNNEVSKSRQANYKGSSFATEMQGTRGANNSSSRKVDKSCEYRNRKTNHVLEECDILRCKPYKERIRFLMEKRFCFGCLREGHIAKNCMDRATCKIANCLRKHPTVLHTNTNDIEKNRMDTRSAEKKDKGTSTEGIKEVNVGSTTCDDNKQRPTLTGAGKSVIARAIVPVKVRVRGTDEAIITYAFLDNESDSTFCTELLAQQLGIEGVKTKMALTTMEQKNSLVDSSIIHNLEVSDLDENNFIRLPVMFTTKEIPIMRDDIPRQEDIEQWTHLEGIHLPNVDAQVGLLIASDIPEALDPLEVKNSQDGGPYATRTALGWAVNGPLYRQHERYHTRNFFVKSDVQLNEIVMDAINRDLNESIADDRTELSQKEQQFMDNVKNTVELNNGHYCIALPFKDEKIQMPNNKPQVEQQAFWLKQKLQKKPKFYADYKAFVENLIQKVVNLSRAFCDPRPRSDQIMSAATSKLLK